jgi:hypothetical protein
MRDLVDKILFNCFGFQASPAGDELGLQPAEVVKIGKIANFIEKVFDDYRKNEITLQKLIGSLCSYADKKIMYQHLWLTFEDELNKQFDEEGNIIY